MRQRKRKNCGRRAEETGKHKRSNSPVIIDLKNESDDEEDTEYDSDKLEYDNVWDDGE